MGAMQLYRASDALVKHRDAIETRLFERAMDVSATVTLFDLTNTYFEGEAAKQPLARHHSKEKRSDCPLLTLGLVLDGSGFVRSRVFAGNDYPSSVTRRRNEAALTTLRGPVQAPRAAQARTDQPTIGRLKAKHRRVAGYYKLDLTRLRRLRPRSRHRHHGRPARRVACAPTSLTDLEAVLIRS